MWHCLLHMKQVVDCFPYNVGQVLFSGCVKLQHIGRNKIMLKYMWIQSIQSRLIWWRVIKQAIQVLGCFQLPGIMFTSWQHGSVCYHAATWGDGSISVAQKWASGSHYGFPVYSNYHQLNASLSVILANTIPPLSPLCSQWWHQQTAHLHNAIHAVCHLSNTTSFFIEMKVMKKNLCRNSLFLQTNFCIKKPAGWSQTILHMRPRDDVTTHGLQLGISKSSKTLLMRLRADNEHSGILVPIPSYYQETSWCVGE